MGRGKLDGEGRGHAEEVGYTSESYKGEHGAGSAYDTGQIYQGALLRVAAMQPLRTHLTHPGASTRLALNTRT